MTQRLFHFAAIGAIAMLAGCGDDDNPPAMFDAGGETPDGGMVTPDSGMVTPDGGGGGTDAGVDGGGGGGCMGPEGLYMAGSCTDLVPGMMLFEPTYRLWSDGADKERYLYLPPGTTIDASNPDIWVFPVGTRAYKTFSLGGLRLETRLWTKTMPDADPSSWTSRVFLWNATQDAVTETTMGSVDHLGTTHDVPARALCARCHSNGATDILLGVSAIQLANATVGVTLADLNAMGLLVPTIAPADADVPGTPVERAALGYLHANCMGCHGGPGPQAGLDFTVPVAATTTAQTMTYMTAVGMPSSFTRPGITGRVVPGMPDASAVIFRMGSRMAAEQMPPVATEMVDTMGVAAVRAWIMAIP